MTGYWFYLATAASHAKQFSRTKINILLTLSEVEVPQKGERKECKEKRTQQFNNISPENVCNKNIFAGFSVSFARYLRCVLWGSDVSDEMD